MLNASTKKASLMKKLAARPPKQEDILGLEGDEEDGEILMDPELAGEEGEAPGDDELFESLNDLDLADAMPPEAEGLEAPVEDEDSIDKPVPVGGSYLKPKRPQKRKPLLA